MRNLGMAVALSISLGAVSALAETPLWEHVPETISPEWGQFFAEKGQYRGRPLPVLDDLEGWKAAQAANDAPKEAHADAFAAMFNVTYEETEIASIPVIRVFPETFKSQDKIGV